MSKDSATDKKARLREWRLEQRALARSNFPLPDAKLQDFFERLDCMLEEASCTHGLTLSRKAIDDMGLSDEESDELFNWCEEHGGYCDCEIAGNTRQHWESVRESN